jgi:hypothetical protein
MPAPKKPEQPGSLEMLIGQLLEATQAATVGLSNLNEETKTNAKAIVAITTTLETVEKTLTEINRLVRMGNGEDSLLMRVRRNTTEIDEATTQLAKIKEVIDSYKADIATGGGQWNMLKWVLTIVAWLVATGLATAGLVISILRMNK